MRQLIAIACFALTAPTISMADEEFRDATVLNAGAYRETDGAVIMPGAWPMVASTKANMNSITVELDGVAITATYETVFKNGKNSAANLVIGQAVRAKLGGRGNRKLIVQIPDGGEVRADVVRRELARPPGE